MHYIDSSILFIYLFYPFNYLVDTFLDHEWIEGIKQYFLFSLEITVLRYICKPKTKVWASLFFLDLDHEQNIVSELQSFLLVSTCWEKPKVQNNLAFVLCVEFEFFLTYRGSPITY